MAKFTEKSLQPDDPLFTGGPQVFTPIARPTESNVVRKPSSSKEDERVFMNELEESVRRQFGQTERPWAPGSIVTVDLEMMGMTLEEYWGEEQEKGKR